MHIVKKAITNLSRALGPNITLSLLLLACALPSQAQTFKKVSVAAKAPLSQVSAGGASVWALATNGQPYILRGGSFALANTISLSQISVGGGSLRQADTVWAIDSSNRIYHAVKSGTTWTFPQVPGSLDLIQVGAGYQDSCHPYEVWGLNTGSQIFRFNFCTNNFVQEPGYLCDIKVGGGDIWGADCGPNVFRFEFSTGFFKQISTPFGGFPELTVGPNEVIWARDTSSSVVYQYDDFLGFVNSGYPTNQIRAGGDGIWIVGSSGNNNIARWDSSAQGFMSVPGSLVSISVGSGGGVWGINSSDQVLAFSTP